MFYQICFYFMLFFFYSLIGWIIETIVCSFWEKRIVLNRGFLIGPYVPIYGTASVIMILFLSEYKADPFILFCMACVYSLILEYVTSYLMEKLFHARWWDYTNKKFNLNGRICLENGVAFGVLGLLLLYVVNPLIEGLLHLFPNMILEILAITMALIMLTDLIVTVVILTKLNISIKNIRSDATYEIDKEFKKILQKYRVLYNRLFSAFPKITFTHEKGGERLVQRLRKSLEEVDSFLKTKKMEIKNRKLMIRDLRKNRGDKKKIQELKNEIKKIRKGR